MNQRADRRAESGGVFQRVPEASLWRMRSQNRRAVALAHDVIRATDAYREAEAAGDTLAMRRLERGLRAAGGCGVALAWRGPDGEIVPSGSRPGAQPGWIDVELRMAGAETLLTPVVDDGDERVPVLVESGRMRCQSATVCLARCCRIRRMLLEAVARSGIARWQASGGVADFTTLTVQHQPSDDLSDVMEFLRGCYRAFRKHRSHGRLAEAAGSVGYVASFEQTWSPDTGWHPHLHEGNFRRGPRRELVPGGRWFRGASFSMESQRPVPATWSELFSLAYVKLEGFVPSGMWRAGPLHCFGERKGTGGYLDPVGRSDWWVVPLVDALAWERVELWAEIVEARGGSALPSFPQQHVRPVDSAEEAAGYLVKLSGSLRDRGGVDGDGGLSEAELVELQAEELEARRLDGWDTAAELVRADLKQHFRGGLMPYKLLIVASDGACGDDPYRFRGRGPRGSKVVHSLDDSRAMALLQEWILAARGSRQVNTSRGVWETLGADPQLVAVLEREQAGDLEEVELLEAVIGAEQQRLVARIGDAQWRAMPDGLRQRYEAGLDDARQQLRDGEPVEGVLDALRSLVDVVVDTALSL